MNTISAVAGLVGVDLAKDLFSACEVKSRVRVLRSLTIVARKALMRTAQHDAIPSSGPKAEGNSVMRPRLTGKLPTKTIGHPLVRCTGLRTR